MHDTLSIIIISKEDQDVIGSAIESVKDLGEILVIDSNNNDLTSNLCKKNGC
jgi:glycosyltransferase involved in cell wall biosynthesis